MARSIRAGKPSSTERIFGAGVVEHGYTALPNILLRAQARLGINTTQFNIIAQLLSYWIDPARPPFPTKRELAKRISITEQTLRINIKALEDAGLLRREQRSRPQATTVRTPTTSMGSSKSSTLLSLILMKSAKSVATRAKRPKHLTPGPPPADARVK